MIPGIFLGVNDHVAYVIELEDGQVVHSLHCTFDEACFPKKSTLNRLTLTSVVIPWTADAEKSTGPEVASAKSESF